MPAVRWSSPIGTRPASGSLADPDLLPDVGRSRGDLPAGPLSRAGDAGDPAGRGLRRPVRSPAWVSTVAPAGLVDRPAAPPELADRSAGDRRGVSAPRALDPGAIRSRARSPRRWAPTASSGASFPPRGVRVLAAVRQFTDHRAVADIEFLDAAGKAGGPDRVVRVRDRRLAQPGVPPQPVVSP